MRSKRWPVRGARPQGDSACREMNGVLLQPCEGHQTAKSTWTQASPLSAGARSPTAREVANCQRAALRTPRGRAAADRADAGRHDRAPQPGLEEQAAVQAEVGSPVSAARALVNHMLAFHTPLTCHTPGVRGKLSVLSGFKALAQSSSGTQPHICVVRILRDLSCSLLILNLLILNFRRISIIGRVAESSCSEVEKERDGWLRALSLDPILLCKP